MDSKAIVLQSGQLKATLLPAEGAVCSELLFANQSLLAKTPWADSVLPKGIAANERQWVENWRGGWQLCAPNIAGADFTSEGPAFHGAASQVPWQTTFQNNTAATFSWQGERGIEITRRFEVQPTHIEVATELTNHGEDQPLGIAEHLILGSDFLESTEEDQAIELEYQAANIIELDYTAQPTGRVFTKHDTGSNFTVLTKEQDARVFSVSQLTKPQITASSGNIEISISWEGLSYLVIWQEFQKSADAPWNNQVMALGLEPTNIPHGAGSTSSSDPIIKSGERLSWRVRLTVASKLKGKQIV
jgi:hypothetical protein